jgi:MFS family permease
VAPHYCWRLLRGEWYLWWVSNPLPSRSMEPGAFANMIEMSRATNMATVIAGRAIQGIRGSGIAVLGEVLICDLVPLRKRSTYMAAVFGMVGIGAALGPLFGGLLVSYTFYTGLPIGGTAEMLLMAFLHVKYDQSQTWATRFSSLDWLGNALFVGGIMSTLIALRCAGGQYAWSSYHVLVCLPPHLPPRRGHDVGTLLPPGLLPRRSRCRRLWSWHRSTAYYPRPPPRRHDRRAHTLQVRPLQAHPRPLF